MKKVLITGGAGLVGATCCDYFASKGWKVEAVDNLSRKKLLGEGGETEENLTTLTNKYPSGITFHFFSVTDLDRLKRLFWKHKFDFIIHAAGQVSHPKSIEIPRTDMEYNIIGTFNLLEILRKYCPKVPMVFTSTNKVYGENPNLISIKEYKTRYKYWIPIGKIIYYESKGIKESLDTQHTLHTPFGVSKLAADTYCQEYGRLYGLKTGIYRLSCVTGPFAKATASQNWIPQLFKFAMEGKTVPIYGWKGKQVRDLLDARDLAEAFYLFYKKPKKGTVYNIGGGYENSCSVLEALKLIEKIIGKKIKHKICKKREGDHKVYITDYSKLTKDYGWKPKIGLEQLFEDIYEQLKEVKT